MIPLLLLLLQAAFIQTEKATVTGVVRLADGKPAVGVRVAAMAADQANADAVNATALMSLAQTDESGRYRLEVVEPGRYYIVAGRVDAPTYYPGVQSAANAASVAVTPGVSLINLDFTIAESSAKPAPRMGVPRSIDIKGRIVLETGSERPAVPTKIKLPSISQVLLGNTTWYRRFVYEPFISPDGRFQIPIPDGQTSLSVEGLPPGYTVKSMTFGPTDLLKERLDATSGGTLMPEIVITLAVDSPQRQD
jgi:hypothetical protein